MKDVVQQYRDIKFRDQAAAASRDGIYELKAMPENVVQLTEKEFCDFLQKKQEELQSREKALRKSRRRLVSVAIATPFVIVLFGQHWIQCLVCPTYLEPEEGDTRELTFHRRHWFSEDTVDRIEVRRSGWGTDEWMKKSKSAEWVQAFEWEDSQPLDEP